MQSYLPAPMEILRGDPVFAGQLDYRINAGRALLINCNREKSPTLVSSRIKKAILETLPFIWINLV